MLVRPGRLVVMDLDPDDPRPPYLQVANALRAAILTKKFTPGEALPSGNELAKRYGVARMTVQQAIRVLRDEGLVVGRQGSGVFVRERTARAVALRPHIEQAFERPTVTIDFAGFSGETLHGALQEPLDKIRVGRLVPERIAIRVLVPDTNHPWGIPCRVDDLEDDPDFRKRAQRISYRHTQAIADSVQELADLGLVKDAVVTIRVFPSPQLFKMYIINGDELFFGFYPITEHSVTLGAEKRAIYDLMGKDTILFHHAITDDEASFGNQYVEQAQLWFESMWGTVSHAPQS
jgi:DNA-binding transcriptional regulator YhcF (GntR family)